ncbi:MAG: hypothetical protein U0670_10310 [Anaerolineae bacterium]
MLNIFLTLIFHPDGTWILLTVLYGILITGSFLPTLRENLRMGETNEETKPDSRWFRWRSKPNRSVFREVFIEESGLTAEEQKALLSKFREMRGTLVYWKKQVAQNKQFHLYVMLWTSVAALLIPIVTQAISDQTPSTKVFLTVISLHSGILLAFHRLLKPNQAFRAYREVESKYYDLLREYLATAPADTAQITQRLQDFTMRASILRQEGRRLELAEFFPSLDQAAVEALNRPLGGGQQPIADGPSVGEGPVQPRG